MPCGSHFAAMEVPDPFSYPALRRWNRDPASDRVPISDGLHHRASVWTVVLRLRFFMVWCELTRASAGRVLSLLVTNAS